MKRIARWSIESRCAHIERVGRALLYCSIYSLRSLESPQVSCYAFYIIMYLVLSTAKLRSIIATLGRHEHASSLRRKLWSVGWRAVAHVATVFLAVLVFLAYPDVFLVYVKKRLLIMVQRVCIARRTCLRRLQGWCQISLLTRIVFPAV